MAKNKIFKSLVIVLLTVLAALGLAGLFLLSGKYFPGNAKISVPEKTIAEQLAECLPKSDLASHEKCAQLLNGIKNFDECVAAGFSIMKSNPPQCTTLDGRSFTDQTNSSWEMALFAINNCEVSKIFQTHSQIVTLTLKNGNKLTAIEPEIDDVFDAAELARAKCGEIRQMATE